MAGCSLFHEEAGLISVRTDAAHYRVGERATVRIVNRSVHTARFVLSCSYYVEQQDAAAWEVVYEEVCPPTVRVAAVVVRPGASEKALVRILGRRHDGGRGGGRLPAAVQGLHPGRHAPP